MVKTIDDVVRLKDGKIFTGMLDSRTRLPNGYGCLEFVFAKRNFKFYGTLLNHIWKGEGALEWENYTCSGIWNGFGCGSCLILKKNDEKIHEFEHCNSLADILEKAPEQYDCASVLKNAAAELCTQDAIPSKLLIAFLNAKKEFFIGYAYKNGSNLRVKTLHDQVVTNKTTLAGQMVAIVRIDDEEYFTGNKFSDIFDFTDFPSVSDEQREKLKNLLLSANQLQDYANELMLLLPKLSQEKMAELLAACKQILSK